ncbi:hypothetical protein pb186bvf_020730 [Paramecium bursaria]
MSQIDVFIPNIRLDQQALNQKCINESILFSPEFSLAQESFHNYTNIEQQQQLNGQDSIKRNITINQISKSIKQNYLKKFLFNQSKVKSIAQKMIKHSQILQDKFRNHYLLTEQYLNNQSLQIYDSINKIKNYIPIINQNNKILQFWEILKIILYLYFMWMMPFKGAFMNSYSRQVQDIILFYLIVFDIILQFNKEIIVAGQLISNRTTIFKYFLKNNFIFELIYLFLYTSITFEILDDQVNQMINIIFFFFNLRKFQQCIKYYQESSIIINEKINLIELIITVSILAHFMACIWYYIGTLSLSYYSESWIIKLNLQNQQIFIQYCYSFYWAATTMATVGYGDITAQNPFEIICSTILIFFSSGIFAFSINSIGMILNNINQNGQIQKRNLLLINQYMTQNQVSSDLQIKIRNYLQFYYQSSQQSHQKDVDIIIDQLSQNLKLELISDVRCKIIQENQFLSKYFSNETKQQIISQSEMINYSPLEQIYVQNSNEDHSLYIISKVRQIQFIKTQEEQYIKINKEILLVNQNSQLENQDIYHHSIKRQNFIQIIKQNQQDFQQFHQLKDQILFNLDAPTSCNICQENHTVFQCNKLFYKPNIEKLIKRDLFHSYQSRYNFNRNRKRNRFQDIQVVKKSCYAFRQDNEFDDDKSYTVSRDSQIYNNTNVLASRHDKTSMILNTNKQINQQNLDKQDETSSEIIINQNPHKNRISVITSVPQDKKEVQIKNKRFKSTVLFNQQSMMSQKQKEIYQFSKLNIDQFNQYISYFPNNNLKQVLKLQDKFQKQNKIEKSIIIPSKYRFYQRQQQSEKKSQINEQ